MPTVSILPRTWGPNATGTSTNQVAGAPFSNLAQFRPSYKWRSNNLTTIRGYLNALSPQPWDAVALLYTNLTAAATWRITASNSSANLWTSPAYNSGHLPFRLSNSLDSWTYWHSYLALVTTQTYQFVGLEIIDASNPAGYVEAGVMVVGELFTPLIGAEVGSSRGFTDTSIMIPLANSETIARRRPRKATASYTFPFQDETHALAWLDFSRVYGNSTPLLVLEQPLNAISRQAWMTYGFLNFRGEVIKSATPYSRWHSSWSVSEI